MNIIEDLFLDIILNYIGGLTRFLFGTSYRIIFNMKTYTFKECLNGPPEDGINYISRDNPHRRSNEFIGLLFVIFIIILLYLIFNGK